MRRKRILREEEELTDLSGASETPRRSLDSVDDQIDGQFILFEKHANDAAKGESEYLLESLRNKSLRAFLFEQEPGEIPTAPDGAPEDLFATQDEPKAEDPAGSENPKKKPEAAKPMKPSLDVDVFAKNVARLCFNAQNLLLVQPVIINRAVRFLEENYGKDYSEKLIDTLDTQFELRIHDEPDVYDAPLAPGAAGKSGG
jgi:hypothetical protein